jgi:hypothetical protein
VKTVDLHICKAGGHFPEHLCPFGNAEERLLFVISKNGDDQPPENLRAAFDQIKVTVGHWIKRTGIDGEDWLHKSNEEPRDAFEPKKKSHPLIQAGRYQNRFGGEQSEVVESWRLRFATALSALAGTVDIFCHVLKRIWMGPSEKMAISCQMDTTRRRRWTGGKPFTPRIGEPATRPAMHAPAGNRRAGGGTGHNSADHGASPKEIIFTSGATKSNNLAA